MKRLSVFGICALACALSLPAQAHGGWGRGGWHGGWHRGYDGGWVAPLVGAAVVGSLLYAATAPVYATPVVTMPVQPAVAPVRVAYYCSSYAAYYPAVANCPVPWQQVAY